MRRRLGWRFPAWLGGKSRRIGKTTRLAVVRPEAANLRKVMAAPARPAGVLPEAVAHQRVAVLPKAAGRPCLLPAGVLPEAVARQRVAVLPKAASRPCLLPAGDLGRVDPRRADVRQQDGRQEDGHQAGYTGRAKVGRRASARSTAVHSAIRQATVTAAGGSA